MARKAKQTKNNDASSASKSSAALIDYGASLSLPCIALDNTVLFPYTLTSLSVSDKASIALVDNVLDGDRLIALFPLRNAEKNDIKAANVWPVGVTGRIVRCLRLPDGSRRILVRGIRRVEFRRISKRLPYPLASVMEVSGLDGADIETEALVKNISHLVQEVMSMAPNLPDELRVALYNIDEHSRLADFVADALGLGHEDRLAVLQTVPVRERLEKVYHFLNREVMVLRLGHEIQEQVSSVFNKIHRENFLREQLKAIQRQLDEPLDTPETAAIRGIIGAAELPPDVRRTAEEELERLSSMHPSSAEFTVARTYIDWLVNLPWCKFTSSPVDLNRARKVLDHDHYNLKQVKERILDFLAVLSLRGNNAGRAPVLCFAGPPGVGKTSLGKSIAHALGREFIRVSLGGIRDEAEIRGHRRTYVGAMPGRIIQGMRKAGTRNPVFMLDEIDKLGHDFRGDPGSALLEVLDPHQNSEFSDHYLELPFDLGQVLFITTANLTDSIPPALRDRMEIIRIPGYTHTEKVEIAKRFLVPRQIFENGLEKGVIRFSKAALDELINRYTSESGVRNLERSVGTICRKHARRLVSGETDDKTVFTITIDTVRQALGPQRLFPEKVIASPVVGVVCGLAWTANGGEVIHIEATRYPGQGNLVLTGSLGDVMKESARIALTLAGSMHDKFGFPVSALKDHDIHVHVPSGATPKDGPSAGIAIVTALTSLFSGRAVIERTAMTGEVSLQGRILPVGGVKEKVLAAVRGGASSIFLPLEAKPELDDEIAPELLKRIRIHYADTIEDVLASALSPISQ